MNFRKLTLGAALCLALVTGGVTVAQNVNPHRHPNLAAAQRLVDQAIGRVDAAQQANEYDMGGHAAKAKELLAHANEELKAAAEEANEHHR
ncbi:MAG: hypothetical protein WB608_08795 [Terracidiphilus sp.]